MRSSYTASSNWDAEEEMWKLLRGIVGVRTLPLDSRMSSTHASGSSVADAVEVIYPLSISLLGH